MDASPRKIGSDVRVHLVIATLRLLTLAVEVENGLGT